MMAGSRAIKNMFARNPRRPRLRHLRIAHILLGGLLGLLNAGCAGNWPPGAGSDRERPDALPVDILVTSTADAEGMDVPEVQVEIPYRSLIFQKRDGAFAAAIQVTVVASMDGERTGGGVGEAKAVVATYAETVQRQKLACRVPLVLSRKDGSLVLDATVKVLETSREWKRRLQWHPQDVRAVPLYFAGFHWNLAPEFGAPEALGIDSDTLRVQLSLQRRPQAQTWPDGGVSLLAIVQPVGQGRPQRHRLPIPEDDVGPDGMVVNLIWEVQELEFGPSVLQIQLESLTANGAKRISLEPSRRFLCLQVPWWDDEQWKLHLSWLEGLCEREQRRELAGLAGRQRLPAWRALWRRIADERGTPAARAETTHMLRIVEADERFGSFGRGAQSDRGRIFILYGPPDTIENRGNDLAGPSRWETWYYLRERLRFTFYDASGMGDYRLYERSSY
jgi:GWxTD domain-containing protein